jgi:SAM-dependent methyltransferase
MNTDTEWQRWNQIFEGDEYYYGDDAGPVARRAVRYARPLFPAGAHALDAGCGEGQDLAYLADEGYIATGIEFTPAGARKTQQLLALRNLMGHVIQGDLRTLEIERQYNLVIAVNAVQFLGADAPRALEKLMAAVVPGGVIGLSLFACDNGETIEGTIYRTSLETLMEKFADWQPYETAKLWQWGGNGQPQPFVTLVARKSRMVRFTL